MTLRQDNRIESFSLSITHSGDSSIPYDLQWEIISYTSKPEDVKVQGAWCGGEKLTYGQVLSIVARALSTMES